MDINRFVGTTSARVGGGGVITSINGTWSGQFYGTRPTGDPNAIVGVFDAHADHASISGSFGAYNTAPITRTLSRWPQSPRGAATPHTP